MLKIISKTAISLIILSFLSFATFAQTPKNSAVTNAMRQEANKHYQNKSWEKSAKAYEQISKLETKNFAAKYRYAMSVMNLGKNQEAEIIFQEILKASPNNPTALALARAYARQGKKENAYKMLEGTLKFGGIAPKTLETTQDFASFKNEKRFKELLKNSDLAQNPCKASPEYRQFDFWIGEWDVKNPQGLVVGSSNIQLILSECIIFENYKTPNYAGKSFNIYDKEDKKWHQTWVDKNGVLTEFVGELKDGKMVYVADEMRSGKRILVKMTFTKLKNGDVNQFGEFSADGGKTWATRYNLTYTKKKK